MQKLSKKKEYRERLLRNLATSLILHEKVETTKARAKALKPILTKLIKYSTTNDLVSRRHASKILFTPKSVKKLFEDLPGRYLNKEVSKNIKYYKLENRNGDNSPMALISLQLKSLETVIKEEEKDKTKKTLKDNKHDE